jgi:hypothetical protein
VSTHRFLVAAPFLCGERTHWQLTRAPTHAAFLSCAQVAVINGPEVGKIGTILRVVRESGTVLVDGVRLKERCVEMPAFLSFPSRLRSLPLCLLVRYVPPQR